jgi:hypothetical protein
MDSAQTARAFAERRLGFFGRVSLLGPSRTLVCIGQRVNVRFLDVDDGLHRTVALAGPTFDTYFWIDVGLSFAFRNRVAFATGNARPA